MIDIVYYTDPLCCWSWAYEAHLQRIMNELNDTYAIRYCMVGLIESWTAYNDDVNIVSRPIQMGPLWMQVKHTANVEIDPAIWHDDPPASSYLACVTVKCAFAQSQSIGVEYLKLLREAVMTRCINIDKQSTLIHIANLVKGLDAERLAADMVNGIGFKYFKEDLNETRIRNIQRTPTIILSTADGKGMIITGYHPFEVLKDKFNSLIKTKDHVRNEINCI